MSSKSDTGQSRTDLMYKETRTMLNYLEGPSTISAQLSAARYFRKLFSMDKISEPWTKDICDRRLALALVNCLLRWDLPELQLDASWALTNIACGDKTETHIIVRAGAVGPLLEIATRHEWNGLSELRDQAVWGLSNIAGDCYQCKSHLIGSGFVPVLLNILIAEFANPANFTGGINSLRTAVWALSNLSRGHPDVPFEQINPVLPILSALLRSPCFASDHDLLADACWTVAYLADDENGTNIVQVQAILDTGVCETLVNHLMTSTSDRLLTGALRAIGNLVSGNDHQTQMVVDQKAVPALLKLLSHYKWPIRREACWALSNIAAGTDVQIEAVLTEPNMICQLVYRIIKDEQKVSKEAVWTFCNAVIGSKGRRNLLMEWGLLHVLNYALERMSHEGTCEAILRAMDELLDDIPDEHTPYAMILRENKGNETLDTLIKDNAGSSLGNMAKEFKEKHLDILPKKGKTKLIEFCFNRQSA